MVECDDVVMADNDVDVMYTEDETDDEYEAENESDLDFLDDNNW